MSRDQYKHINTTEGENKVTDTNTQATKELKPWQADIDAECPSSLAMDCVTDPGMKQEIISAIASMTDRKRVIFEVHMASELRRMVPMRTHVQKKINTWLEHCSDRLDDCMATVEVN